MDSKHRKQEITDRNINDHIFKDIWQHYAPGSLPDLNSLGEAITYIGIRFRQKGMLFKGAKDKALRSITREFPRIIRTSHPILVLDTGPDLYHRVCPCTSKFSNMSRRYIKAECKLEITGRVSDRTTFILDCYAFNLPIKQEWIGKLRFMGLVPNKCIKFL